MVISWYDGWFRVYGIIVAILLSRVYSFATSHAHLCEESDWVRWKNSLTKLATRDFMLGALVWEDARPAWSRDRAPASPDSSSCSVGAMPTVLACFSFLLHLQNTMHANVDTMTMTDMATIKMMPSIQSQRLDIAGGEGHTGRLEITHRPKTSIRNSHRPKIQNLRNTSESQHNYCYDVFTKFRSIYWPTNESQFLIYSWLEK